MVNVALVDHLVWSEYDIKHDFFFILYIAVSNG